MKRIVALLLLGVGIILAGGDSIPDLENKLKKVTEPEEKIKILNQLAFALRDNSPALTIKYATQALTLSRELQNKKTIPTSLNIIGIGHTKIGNYETALEFFYQAREVYRQMNNTEGIGIVCSSIGNIFWYYSDYEKALGYYNRALNIFKKLNKQKRIAATLNNRAAVYKQWGKLDKALEDYLEALKIKEEIGAPEIAFTIDNIGCIYENLGDYEKSLQYHNKALKLFAETGNKMGMGRSLNNLGTVYKTLQNFDRALEYYRQSKKIKEEVKDRFGLTITLKNIGDIYLFKKDFQKALEYQEKSRVLCQELGDKFQYAQALSSAALIYKEMEQYKPALQYLNNSIELARQSGARKILKENYRIISEIYFSLGNSDRSLEYYKKYTAANEEIFNKAAVNKIRQIELKYEKEQLQKRIQKTSQKTFMIFLGVVSLLALTLALLTYNRYRLKNKTRQLLEQNKQEIEIHKSKLKVLNEQLKEFLRLKNRKRYEKSTLTPKQAKLYQKKLLKFMEEEKPYLDSELTVNLLAEQVSISPRYLSQVINERINKNFCDFINHYRVEEAKKILTETVENKEISILDIAFDVGFNSKSSFNTVFKNHTGMTPSQFRENAAHISPAASEATACCKISRLDIK